MPDILIMTENNDEFEINPHYDDSASDPLEFESWNSVDVKGGRWIYDGELCIIPDANDIGSDTEIYITLTITPGTGAGAITAETSTPNIADWDTIRLIGVLNFETDPGSASGEYPTSPPWDSEEVIVDWTQHLRSTQYTFIGAGGSDPHRFQPSINAFNSDTVDISTGGWNVNGHMETDSKTGLGQVASESTTYIIATITMGTAKPLIPSDLTISAVSSLPASNTFRTIRVICALSYSGSTLTGINRYQVGDIYQHCGGINTGSGVWTDGGAAGVSSQSITDMRYDTYRIQVKYTTRYLINGTWYEDEEDASWTTMTTASPCTTP